MALKNESRGLVPELLESVSGLDSGRQAAYILRCYGLSICRGMEQGKVIRLRYLGVLVPSYEKYKEMVNERSYNKKKEKLEKLKETIGTDLDSNYLCARKEGKIKSLFKVIK